MIISTPRSTLLALLASAVLLTATVASHADPTSSGPTPQQIKQAGQEFTQGANAAKAGDHETAAEHFETAYHLAPSPAALRAAIKERREAKQGAKAATLAERALARHADDKDLSELAKAVLAQFASQYLKVAVTCEPKCLLTVDQRLVSEDEFDSTAIYVDAGKHVVTAGWGDKSASKNVEGKAGDSTDVKLTQPKEEPKAVPPPPKASASAPAKEPEKPPVKEPPKPEKEPKKEGSGLPPAVFIAGAVVTGALGAVTVWSGLDAVNNPGTDRVKQQCAGQGTSCPAYQDGVARQDRTNTLIGVTAGVGVVTGVIGLFLTNWGGSSVKKSTGLYIAPSVDVIGRSSGLSAAGRF